MLTLRRRLRDFGSALKVEIIETHSFDSLDMSKYIQLFDKYCSEGLISANSFNDDNWIYYRPNDGSQHSILFDLNVYPLINTALKCFIILKISSGNTSFITGFRYLKEICFITQGLDVKTVHLLEEYIITGQQHKTNIISTYLPDFSTFIKHEQARDFISICDSYRKSVQTIRDLPKYSDILIFDYVVDHFL